MDLSKDDLARDLDAALQTRKELGPEYESALVDSFLARLDARLDAGAERRTAGQADPDRPQRPRGGQQFKIQVLSLVMGVPLSGVAAGTCGLAGLVVCWAGIVGINLSSALSGRGRERRRDGWG
ncbi:hypothetical protein [Kitasatospora sp. NPDC059571]|uniref:hypothetical protein n=1 Tax=Kitasatospora sp. NPDC059571 TaxID=3346871 RepID=UPI0036A05891